MTGIGSAGARRMRRSWPIHGYVGPNGSGKSLAMVNDTMPSLDMGRPVLSTVRLVDWRNLRPCDDETCTSSRHGLRGHFAKHPSWIPLTSYNQLLEFHSGDVLLDEVTGVASSREHHKMPTQVVNLLVQLRRRDVVLRWSAPSWARADVIIRECSQAVTFCLGRFPVDKTAADGTERAWRQRRVGWWRTYDAMDFEDFTVGKREDLGTMAREIHWIPGSRARLAYDTYDQVLSISDVSDVGTCTNCGGTRRRHECICHDYQEAKGQRSGRGPAARSRRGAPSAVPTPLELVQLTELRDGIDQASSVAPIAASS